MEYGVQNAKALEAGELTESELNRVAGGEGPLLPVIREAVTKAHLEQLAKERPINLYPVGGPSPY
jgi:hypothetical protein